MTDTASTEDARVLMLTPIGRDFELAKAVFERHGVAAVRCDSLLQACNELDAGAGALVVVEEAINESDRLQAWIDAQPPWSDLPVLVLARPGVDHTGLSIAVERLRNVTILERPTRVAALVTAVRSALRARARQYQLRDHLFERARAEEELRQNDRRKDEFLAILAHELRNPLAPISNALHILKLTRSDNPQTVAVGQMIERQVRNLKRLVDDLLEVSRVTRGEVDLRRERVELSSVIRVAVDASLPLIDAARHHFEVAMPPEPIVLYADPVRLAQILSNILNNAAKYTEHGGSIALTAVRDHDRVAISVSDNGMGIPLEAQDDIFKLFTQVEQNRGRAQGGLGIGLTLVKSLVELHGGTVEVFSEGSGRGSRFTVRLPVLAEVRSGVADAELDPQVNLTGLEVLVVDDNRDAADSLAWLMRQSGARVQVAYDGASGLNALEKDGINAAVIDLGMLGMDGLEVARRARTLPHGKKILLIALTGWGQERDIRATREAGFDHHLIKPVDLSLLMGHMVRAAGKT